MRGFLAVALLTPVLVAVASTPAQGVDEWCGLDGTPGLETFRWKPTVSSGAWEEPANWEGAGSAQGNLDAATGYVCIPAGARVSIGAGIEGRVQALDIASGGQLDILEGGKVFVYGDHQTRPTHVAGATLTLTAGGTSEAPVGSRWPAR